MVYVCAEFVATVFSDEIIFHLGPRDLVPNPLLTQEEPRFPGQKTVRKRTVKPSYPSERKQTDTLLIFIYAENEKMISHATFLQPSLKRIDLRGGWGMVLAFHANSTFPPRNHQ